MASEHESHEKESAKVEDDAGTQTVEDKQLHHSMSSRYIVTHPSLGRLSGIELFQSLCRELHPSVRVPGFGALLTDLFAVPCSSHTDRCAPLIDFAMYDWHSKAEAKSDALMKHWYCRDERPLDGIPHPHGEQQSPRHVTVNITDEHAGQTNLLNPNASRITSSEDFPNSICHPDAAHPMTVRACPVVSGKEQHPDPFLDCGRQGKEKASPALSHPREAGTLQERGSPVPLEEQLATLSASEVHSAQIVESANVSTGQNAQPEAALGFPIGVVVADVVENRNKDNAQGQGNPSPNVMPALAVRAMRPTESGKSNFNEMPCVSIDDPMCMWNSNRNTPRSMERVETLRQDPAGKDSSEARGCQGQMTEATDTRDDPSCPGLAVGPSYGECVKVPTFPPSSVPALQQASSRGVVSGTILTNALPKRSSGGCNRLQALVRTSSLAATQLSAPALLKSATYRKSADGGHPGRSPFPVQGPAKQANRHTAKLQGSNPTLASRLDDASTSRHSSFFQSGGHDLLKPTSIPTSSESARTVDPDPARSMDASSTRVKSGDPNSISLKQGERAGTTEMDHSTKVPVQPDPKTGALVGEDAPYQGRPPTSSQIVTNALQLAPPRRSGGTLRTATAQLAVQIQKTSQACLSHASGFLSGAAID